MPRKPDSVPWLFGLGLAGAVAALYRFTRTSATGLTGNRKAELYRNLVENSSEAIVVIDATSKGIVEFNRAFLELTGFPEESISAIPLSQFIAISPEGMEKIFRIVTEENQSFMGEVKYFACTLSPSGSASTDEPSSTSPASFSGGTKPL